jgi:hypothetical protein
MIDQTIWIFELFYFCAVVQLIVLWSNDQSNLIRLKDLIERLLNFPLKWQCLEAQDEPPKSNPNLLFVKSLFLSRYNIRYVRVRFISLSLPSIVWFFLLRLACEERLGIFFLSNIVYVSPCYSRLILFVVVVYVKYYVMFTNYCCQNYWIQAVYQNQKTCDPSLPSIHAQDHTIIKTTRYLFSWNCSKNLSGEYL